LYANTNYGFSDDRLRIKGGFQKKFNNISKPFLQIEGGVETQQINNTIPIKTIVNDIATLFFERNYLKIYERQFAEVFYSQEIVNGLRGFGAISYERRLPLFNTTDQTFFPKNDEAYTSNNPLLETVEGVPSFQTHNIVKFSANAQIVFGQKFYSYPDGKFNSSPEKYPILLLGYEGGYSATVDGYDFHELKARITQSFNIGNKGRFGYNFRAGTFIDAEDISYVDYKHFNGNQTRVGTTTKYLDKFNLLPYYALSTNDAYLEGHLEHDFKGFILNKIPLINKLGFNLVLGGHLLSTADNKPYTEYSVGLDNVGFGKFRFFRVDYVRNNFNGSSEGAFVFGLKFLNILGLE